MSSWKRRSRSSFGVTGPCAVFIRIGLTRHQCPSSLFFVYNVAPHGAAARQPPRPWWRPLPRKEPAMRACMLFVTGLLVGVALHTVAAQSPNSPNKGLVQVNHIGMNVPNLDEAVTFYTKTMGFPEAFRVNDEKGQARLVYVQISKNTFFEIQPGPGRPAAINHVGIHVENMAAATAMFKARGVNIGEIRASDTKAILNNITDPNRVRIQLAELPPESMHRQAMNRWK